MAAPSDYIRLLRPAQWVKNVFVFVALVFGERLLEPVALLSSLGAFVVFCMLASAVYAFNDVRDRAEDALHPTKKSRPIANGSISPTAATVLSFVLACGALAFARALDASGGFLTTALLYLGVNLFYSLGAKHVALLDVILVAVGFVLRALGGAQVIHVEVSAWLVICTFTLCLFLGFGKRRCEVAMIQGEGGDPALHRAALVHYTPHLLTNLLATTGVLAVVTFVLYTMDPHTAKFRALFFTTPLVLYAVFRYALVIESGERTGPSDILIRDRPFLATCIVWTILAVLIVFKGKTVEPFLPRLRWPGAEVRTFAPTPATTTTGVAGGHAP